MMMFQLPEFTPAKVTAVNVRAEHHGEELVPAIDLKFKFKLPNHVLSCFDPQLRELLYQQGPPNKQAELDGVAAATDLPALRFPRIVSAYEWDEDLNECQIDIDFPGHEMSLMHMRMGKFKLEPSEGGTVEVTCTAQSTLNPGEEKMGKLCGLAQRDVRVRVVAL